MTRTSLAAAAFVTCIVGIVPALAGYSSQPLRLSPSEIADLPSTGAGAGTSGVAGVRTTVLSGDPLTTGPYTIALRVPANTAIAAHSHRDARSAVVVSGIWWFGYGARATEADLRPLPPGSFYREPAGSPHFARTGDTPVVVYITGFGPTDTRYVAEPVDPAKR